MDERACPSVDEIRDFLNEQLVPARDQEVSLHIQECPSCSELMTTVADSDETQNDDDLLPVLAEIRTLQNDQGFEAEDGCLQAVERARQIPEQSSNSAIDSGSNDADSRAAPPSKLGPYELGDEIGTGGMGSVYRATHSKLGRTVAVKVLHGRRLNHPAAIARFEREMKTVGQLEHPNIVRATDADEDDGVQYLVMEYLDGVDLSSLVRQRGPLPVAEACELVRQAALGLQHAHENGFVHRDIKPANLMLCRAYPAERGATVAPRSARNGPCVKILDLGLAQLENPTDEEALTSTGQAVGTIEYMAPEQIDETQQVDIRADIYGLGATLYKLLTGQSPLENGQPRSRLQKLKALANDESPAITDLRNDLPAPLVEVIGRMLSHSPDDRYATPQEVAEALLPHTKNANLAEMIHSLGPVVDSETDLPGKAARNLQSATTKLRINLPRWGAFAALAIVVVIVIIQKNSTSTESDPEPPPPAVARRTSIRLEDRTLIFEDQYESTDQITVRSDGQTLTLLRKNAVFTADIGYGDATHAFSIRTSEFDGLQLLLSAGDDYVTLEDVSGINGDLKIDGGEGEDRIDVSGKVSLGRHSLAASIDSVLFFKDTALSATEHGSIYLNATRHRSRRQRPHSSKFRISDTDRTRRYHFNWRHVESDGRTGEWGQSRRFNGRDGLWQYHDPWPGIAGSWGKSPHGCQGA